MKYVYMFDEGNKDMRELLGGKGANLAEMTNLGLPIPKGFTITTEACKNYYENNESLTSEIKKEIMNSLSLLEKLTNKKFGNKDNPLLVSVRSGARVSMPGMLDTVLNLGLNDEIVSSLVNKTKNERFVYDSYRRFIQMYSNVVMGIDESLFGKEIDKLKEKRKVKYDINLDSEDIKLLVNKFKDIYHKELKEDFPQDVKVQLMNSIGSVFRSWNNERAKIYRKLNNIPDTWGTAVNIQTMVYGNLSLNSGTGVAFTRNPSTGENKMYGEYLINAQGEDVVAGIRTPEPISKLKEILPDVYKEFIDIAKKLENHYRDMQDMEFTIEDGKLYILQTRIGKRTSYASVKIVNDLVKEKMITKEEALLRIEANSIDQFLHSTFNPEKLKTATLITKGLPASPGAASGKIVFNAKDALKSSKLNEDVILVRLETNPEDIEGMLCSKGFLTVRGGITSHAAVVARGLGKCCISGCSAININEKEEYFEVDNKKYKKGDYISLNGINGSVYKGKIDIESGSMSPELKKVIKWANEIRRLRIRTNADNVIEVKKALELGAEGIGLCRTEHMFFEKNRIPKIRKMIFSKTLEEREKALKELIPYQKKDFTSMYEVLKKLPMTVRYLDFPLHEILPKNEEEFKVLSKEMNMSVSELKQRSLELQEVNPMMGHRGCRLSITYPEIARMQTTALVESAIEVSKKLKISIVPEIMLPLIGDIKEFNFLKNIIIETIDEIKKKYNYDIKYKIGAMLEVPRAALLSDEISKSAEFFSFGTNDLTQMVYGFSRDDAGKFLNSYYDNKIFERDPFITVDRNGVGKLMEIAVKQVRKEKPNISLGICGEHGGESRSIEFFDKIGLDYVSCSPYRVPIAILASAQATIKNKR